MMKIALVSTFINAAPVLASWLERHRQLGISQFYLFTDTPAETGRYAAHTAPDILWTPRDDALISRWQALPSWDEYAPYCEGEWYARQCLNADLAFNQAKADGCDWLIHLDIDEELYAPGARSLAETLVAHAGNDLLHFANHEAIPEAWHIDDYFRDVTLFKKHHEVLTEPQRLLAMKHFGTRYYLAYGNGKAAANLHGSTRCAEGAHWFKPCISPARAGDICVLHFPNCGFNWFYEKFLSIGHFPDNWLGHTAIEPLLPFMIESRGAVTHGNIHDATRLYQERVMHQGGLPGSLAELLDAGILMRIERPILTLL